VRRRSRATRGAEEESRQVEQVRVSRANAYARLERLTSTGVITGFSATVDPVRLGLATSAYVTLSVRQNSWRDLKAARRVPRGHA